MSHQKLRVWLKEEKRYSYHDLTLTEDVGGLAYILEMDMPRGEYQFDTGLKDKNGKEIYKGDIVRTWHGFIKFREKTIEECSSKDVYDAYQSDKYLEDMHSGDWVCEYEKASFVFSKNHKKCIGMFVGGITEHCEVMGNIYENSDLLGE